MTATWRSRSAARLHLWADRIARRAGLPGLLAAVLLLAAAVLHIGVLPRMRTAVAELQRTTALLHDELAPLRALPPTTRPGERLEHLLAALPVVSDAAQLSTLERLHESARAAQLALEQGSYRLEAVEGEPLARLDIVVNAKGSYAQLRGFALRALQGDPALALASLRLGRASAGDPVVDGEIRFTLFMRKP